LRARLYGTVKLEEGDVLSVKVAGRRGGRRLVVAVGGSDRARRGRYAVKLLIVTGRALNDELFGRCEQHDFSTS